MEKFPKGFLFGSGTSAHQIEGHQNNDWSRWEKLPGKIDSGDTSEVAADSFNKWQDDIKLLRQTSQNAYRFSIEWSRIEPEEGKFDEKAIKHYLEIINSLRKNQIEPMVTLFHFTCPLWLDDIGGWTNRKAAYYFARFAGRMAKEFGSKVKLWSVINEPNVYVMTGFIAGNWYPGRRGAYFTAVRVYFNLIRAQKQAYRAMKQEANSIQVGIAYNMSAFFPARPIWCDKLLTGFAKWLVNEFFLNRTKNYLDFVGVNHYLTHFIRCSKKIIHDQITETEKYQWPQKPRGILEVIKEASKYRKPIYITENGIPDDKIDDLERQKYLQDVFLELEYALREGVDLRGYFYWSLLDNFEWSSGYGVKFGLHTIDRKPRKSAETYKQIINNLVNR